MELFDVYSLYDIEPVVGKGSRVYTADGTEYLDFYGGHAVISIGHSHPQYVKAISDQVSKLGFYSNSVINSLQNKLAEKLGAISGYNDYNLFLSNSGAEANENAIKIASFHTGRKKILAIEKAFHGRTSGAVAATDNRKIVSPFNETDNVTFSPINNLEFAGKYLNTGEYAAVIIEGIQGVAGIHVPDKEFVEGLINIAHENGTLIIFDEIQSGYGRTGKFFAHQHYGVKADIVTCAKGIANGFPMGATLITPAIKALKGMLGTTFGGNHLACAAANCVIDVINNERLIENAAKVGEFLINELKKINGIKDVRGKGLMIGFDIEGKGSEFRKKLLFEKNIFTGGAGENTIRLLPALNISMDDAKTCVAKIKEIIG